MSDSLLEPEIKPETLTDTPKMTVIKQLYAHSVNTGHGDNVDNSGMSTGNVKLLR